MTKEEIQENAISMRSRGYTYRSVLTYLNNNLEEETDVRGIIAHINDLERKGLIKIESIAQTGQSKSEALVGKFIGGTLILFGIALIYFLWDMGYVATLPLALIGFGVYAFTGQIR